jgi:glycosyltransferase involved in cell wall biosynthesis
MKVAICISTYQRPRLLARLLSSINSLEVPADLCRGLSVFVVDNDAAASAKDVLDSARPDFRCTLVYAVEPERNISLARNRGVQLALSSGANFVAFVDDDEEVCPTWLAELLHVQAKYGADVVNGRVISRLPEGVPDWIRRRDFFGRGGGKTGSRMPGADTGNSLVSAELLSVYPGPFDPAFGLSGGGDSHFFQRARFQGAKIICANNATVIENVPAGRASAWWLLKRSFRMGNHAALVDRKLRMPRRWLPRRVVKATVRIGLGMLMLLVAPLIGRAGLVAALQQISRGLGSYAGLLGYRVIAYRRVDGD